MQSIRVMLEMGHDKIRVESPRRLVLILIPITWEKFWASTISENSLFTNPLFAIFLHVSVQEMGFDICPLFAKIHYLRIHYLRFF